MSIFKLLKHLLCKLLFTPVCAQRGGPLGSMQNKVFYHYERRNFRTKLSPHLCKYKTTIIQQKKKKKKKKNQYIYHSKWRPNTDF